MEDNFCKNYDLRVIRVNNNNQIWNKCRTTCTCVPWFILVKDIDFCLDFQVKGYIDVENRFKID